MAEVLEDNFRNKIIQFASKYIQGPQQEISFIAAADSLNPNIYKEASVHCYVGLMNNERFINKRLEQLNSTLKLGDLLIGRFETYTSKRRRFARYRVPVLRLLFMAFDFVFHRVMPKINGTKQLYFSITKGKNRLLSKAEMLGRIVSCGYEIIGNEKIEGTDYFIIKKIKEPTLDMKPSYGPIFSMNRLGYGGKIIKVYKFRTMHPYSEYLHDYVLKKYGYAQSGKPANDFRLTPWGKLFRKYWIDELPQLFNILKGEMKLVGVRPVSQRYFQDIPEDLQKLRNTQKPGCIPPYVALNVSPDVESVQNAERIYLMEKIQRPYTTDLRYFFKALFSIIVRRKRSA
jgi:lipopolysaccharide/colanic/teichoic acid biosynthesis glycosyltransferase